MGTLSIIPTYRCNLHCAYCFNDTHEGVGKIRQERKELVSQSAVEDVVRAALKRGFTSFLITGGEPLLASSLGVWLAAIGRRRNPLRIISNATVLKSEVVEMLANHNNLSVCASLGGATDRMHARFRGPLADWKKNVRRLRERDIRVDISYVLDAENFCELEELERLAGELDCKVHAVGLSPGENPNLTTIGLEHVAEADWTSALGRVRSPALRSDLLFMKSALNGSLQVRHCSMRTRNVVLDPWGDVFGCFYRNDIRYGNVLDLTAEIVFERIPVEQVLPANCFGKHCWGIHHS